MTTTPERPGKPQKLGISRRAAARILGCSHDHLSRLVLEGVLPALDDGTIDLATARRVVRARQRARGGKDRAGYDEAHRRRVLAEAEIAELTLKERAPRLVDVAAAEQRLAEIQTYDRAAWAAWPSWIGPEIATRLGLDPATVTAELERLVTAHLAERPSRLPNLRAGHAE